MVFPPIEAFQATVEVLEAYKGDPEIQNPNTSKGNAPQTEDFLTAFLTRSQYSNFMKQKIAEIFFKILKHKQFFDMIISAYYSSRTKQYPRIPRDYSLLLVMVYVAIMELSCTTKSEVIELLLSLHKQKALAFFGYLKRPLRVLELYDWASGIWDVDYVKEMLHNITQDPLLEETYLELLKFIESEKKGYKNPTVPVDMKVLRYTKKTPRSPKPEVTFSSRIPVCIKPCKIPKSTYVRPEEDKKLSEIHMKNRKEAIKLYEEAQKNALNCAKSEKSRKYQETIRKIEEERTPKPQKFKKVIVPDGRQSPKVTAAFILRRGARLMKQEKEEIKRFQELEGGAFNSYLIMQWEKELREEQMRRNLEEIERKHLQGLISYEEAILTRQKCLKRNKEKREEFKKEREIWLRQLEEWKCEQQSRIQEGVEKGKAIEKGARDAMEHAKEEKHKSALELMEESRILRERMLKEREEDLIRKILLIQEIKALQSLSALRPKKPDLTETGNVGLLCEMSIAELRERLLILRIEVNEEIERRREEIRQRRQCRQEVIDSYQGLINSHCKIMKQIKQEPEKKKSLEASEITSPCIVNLRKKLEAKRLQRLTQEVFA